jgi:hypothetical protein
LARQQSARASTRAPARLRHSAMNTTRSLYVRFLPALLGALSCGCSPDEANVAGSSTELSHATGDQVAATSSKPVAAAAGYAAGRITMADGQPLRGEVKDISVSISGVSEAAERVQYAPAVKPDGTYRQKLAPGQYVFNASTITVVYQNGEHRLPLEPVGAAWNKNRDAEEGIVQDFLWKVTGPTPYGQSEGLDTNNATHWYGMSIGLRPDGWRNDTNAAPTSIPDGTRMTFTLEATGPAIDGRELEPIVVERSFKNTGWNSLDLADIPPAPYRLSGVATLPDGSTKPLLLQGQVEYPAYAPTVQIKVEKDSILGKIAKPLLSFVLG